MTVQRRRAEGICHVGPAYRVEDDVEAGAIGASRHIIGHLFLSVVDRCCAHARDERHLPVPGAGCKDFRPEMTGQLHRDVTDSPGTTMDQHLLTRRNPGPLQPFPGSDPH